MSMVANDPVPKKARRGLLSVIAILAAGTVIQLAVTPEALVNVGHAGMTANVVASNTF